MKVLLLNYFSYTGQTTHVFSLGRELMKQGVQPVLLMPDFPQESYAQYQGYLESLGFEIMITKQKKEQEKLFRKHSFHIIHAHSPLSYAFARQLSVKFNIPYVLSCHGLGIGGERFKDSLQGAKRIICISPRVASSLNHDRNKISIIPNGIDLEEFSPGNKSLPVKIMYAGRLDEYKRKGFLALEKALNLLYSSGLSFEFHCAANVHTQYPKGKNLGWVPSIAPYVQETDIIVGTGRAILEGMAAGNAGVVLGRMWGGVVTKDLAAKSRFYDLSGISGSDLCYKTMFFALAKLVKNNRYLREIQQFSTQYVERKHNGRNLTKKILAIYQSDN